MFPFQHKAQACTYYVLLPHNSTEQTDTLPLQTPTITVQLASSCESTAFFLYRFLHIHQAFCCTVTVPKVIACCCCCLTLSPHCPADHPHPLYAICLTWFKTRLPVIHLICTDHRGPHLWVFILLTECTAGMHQATCAHVCACTLRV